MVVELGIELRASWVRTEPTGGWVTTSSPAARATTTTGSSARTATTCSRTEALAGTAWKAATGTTSSMLGPVIRTALIGHAGDDTLLGGPGRGDRLLGQD